MAKVEEMVQELGPILSTTTVDFNGNSVYVVQNNDSGDIVNRGSVLYGTEGEAEVAMVEFARSFAADIEKAMTNRVNEAGEKIARGAWPKTEKVAFLRYQNVYLEQEMAEQKLQDTIELLKGRGMTEEQIQELLG